MRFRRRDLLWSTGDSVAQAGGGAVIVAAKVSGAVLRCGQSAGPGGEMPSSNCPKPRGKTGR